MFWTSRPSNPGGSDSARGEPGTSGEKSTGLGLAIVHKIASSHGGSVEAGSGVGKSTTFTALFPP